MKTFKSIAHQVNEASTNTPQNYSQRASIANQYNAALKQLQDIAARLVDKADPSVLAVTALQQPIVAKLPQIVSVLMNTVQQAKKFD